MKPLLLIIGLLLATSAQASQSIHVEWGYTPPSAPAVTGYRLYQNNVARIVWVGAATTAGDVLLDSIAFGDVFTLTATFDDATESPHSAPYLWQGGSAIKFISLRPANSRGWMTKPGQARLR